MNTKEVGKVAFIARHPVKSMAGLQADSAEVLATGLLGDRAWSLLDAETGLVVSAKNPRRWPGLLDATARFLQPPSRGEPAPPVEVSFPGGTVIRSDADDCDEQLSRHFGRAVKLSCVPPPRPALEQFRPETGDVTGESIPAGGFFDAAPLHLLTTATLARLRELHTAGDVDVRRFRPNLVVELPGNEAAFAENDWVGRRLSIGDSVEVEVTGPCPRCVMTTLAQADLPADPEVLRTAARHNGGNVGVYARVLREGVVREGDGVRVVSGGR